jgi:hypothetical protein
LRRTQWKWPEDNDKNHFISSYEITPEAFDDFEATGTVVLQRKKSKPISYKKTSAKRSSKYKFTS